MVRPRSLETRVPRDRWFQVGPDGYLYTYKLLKGVNICDRPVYECARGRDNDTGTLILFFDGKRAKWHATSMPCAVTGDISHGVIEETGTKAFRAEGEDEDVRVLGYHSWQCWDKMKEDWGVASKFWTAVKRPQQPTTNALANNKAKL